MGKCPGCGPPAYAADAACPTVCSKHFPGTPSYAGADPEIFPWPVPGHDMHDFAIEDILKVPTSIPAGDYVLGWRWDCEMTSQVWSNCADITIEKSTCPGSFKDLLDGETPTASTCSKTL